MTRLGAPLGRTAGRSPRIGTGRRVSNWLQVNHLGDTPGDAVVMGRLWHGHCPKDVM